MQTSADDRTLHCLYPRRTRWNRPRPGDCPGSRGAIGRIGGRGGPSSTGAACRRVGPALTLREWSPGQAPAPAQAGELWVAPVPLHSAPRAGQLDPRNAQYVLSTLDLAIEGCLKGHFDALVTGPVHKGVINDAGIAFTGHTEYLAEKTATPRVVMMLATEGLRVALATTHLPLQDVAVALTAVLLPEILDVF